MLRLITLLLAIVLHLPGMEASEVYAGSERTEESIEVLIGERVEHQSRKKVLIQLKALTEPSPKKVISCLPPNAKYPERHNQSIYLLKRCLLI